MEKSLLQEAENFFYETSEIEIENNEQFEGMSENLKKAKNLKKEIDKQRKEEKDPFTRQAKSVDDRYKPTLDKLDQSIKTMESDLKMYIQKEEVRKRQAEMEAQEKANASENEIRKVLEEQLENAKNSGMKEREIRIRSQLDNLKIEVGKPISEIDNIAGQHTRKTWKGELVDIKKVPKKYLREFFKLDQAALNQFARKHEGKVEIEGVRFYEDISIVNRS